MAKMDSKPASSCQRIYEDIVPAHHELIRGEGLDADTITIHIAGFKRADLKVQIDQHGKLMVTGERFVGENKWVRFHKYFETRKYCNQTGIRARFENERISITLPKIFAERPAQTATQDKPASEPEVTSHVDQNEHTKKTNSEKMEENRKPPSIDAQNKLEQKEPEPNDRDSKSTDASDSEAGSDDVSKADSHEAESTEQPAGQQRLSMRLSAIKHKALEYGSRKAICGAFVVLVISVGVGLMNYQ